MLCVIIVRYLIVDPFPFIFPMVFKNHVYITLFILQCCLVVIKLFFLLTIILIDWELMDLECRALNEYLLICFVVCL